METLNIKSTEIFCRLIDRMNGEAHLKINNEPFMPLSIEQIVRGIEMPSGSGSLYSLCHYYEQNGDLMQDPEMCFIVVDNRQRDTTAWNKAEITPYMFQQANVGIYQESILFKDSKPTELRVKMQADHTEFANHWLRNIYGQGFLK